MDLFVSILAGLALFGMLAARWCSYHARQASRLLQRLEVRPAEGSRRAPGGPLLEGLAIRVAATGWGARLHGRAESNHPGVPFSDILALGLASALGGGLFALLFFGRMSIAAAIALIAPLAVDRFFKKLHGNRAARVEKQLPEALAFQANVLRAGQSLSRSLKVLSEETKPPFKEELERMLAEV
ncbi:MAG TPA: hypothetical protein VEU28_07095, partial [Actinomycetota bacterium]|nr:hypothetical protein [Actinomycetota bacterium]